MLAYIAGLITAVIAHLGYAGVALLMAIESACIPLPSEIIMPFSGYLVSRGELVLWLVALAGAVGSVIGSLVDYGVGAWGGRPVIERYGKYLLITHHDLDLADRWFARHGDITILIGRMLPVVRTFIGSFIWCWALGWLGLKLGEHWHSLGEWFHRFDALIVALLLAAAIWYVRRHLRLLRS